MKRTLAWTALLCFYGLCSWKSKQNNPISTAGWLIGTWENKTPKGSMFETWRKTKPDEFTGKSYAVKQTDTTVFETIRMVEENGRLVYIPTVKNENGGLPVRFEGRLVSESTLTFENPGHDFPQKISYTKIHPDSLVAEISGTRNGKERKLTFPMRRVR